MKMVDVSNGVKILVLPKIHMQIFFTFSGCLFIYLPTSILFSKLSPSDTNSKFTLWAAGFRPPLVT